MTLIKHEDKYRRIWMFPRNIRSIYPWKIAQISSLLQEQLKFGQWAGNQRLQNAFCRALEKAGLKRAGHQYDSHSGGPRTYLSQLKCLGLVFQRPDNSIWFTKAGEDLIQGCPPLPILQNLLLRHQYPSAYSQLGNVKIHPDIKVKPFLFVLEILSDSRIRRMTVDELIVPVIYGHNNDCLGFCIEKILTLRAGKSISDVIANKTTDLFTPRTKKRTFSKALIDIRDVANTCKNYLQSCCLINTEKQDGKEFISFNPDIKNDYQIALNEKGRFIRGGTTEESFQRAYGCWNIKKDTRTLVIKAQKVSKGESIIKAMFMEYCGNHIVSQVPEDFIEDTARNFGFSKDFILKTIRPLLGASLSYFESTFLDLSKGGQTTAVDFEKAICNLFKNRLLFKSAHTGQKRRPFGVGGYGDVFIVALDNVHCAIIDAKASPNYNISSSDYRAMVKDYIGNYRELCEGKNLLLEFCLYIAGGFFFTGVKQKLKQLYKETKIPVSAVSAVDFLHLARRTIKKEEQSLIRNVFKQNDIVSVIDFKFLGNG